MFISLYCCYSLKFDKAGDEIKWMEQNLDIKVHEMSQEISPFKA